MIYSAICIILTVSLFKISSGFNIIQLPYSKSISSRQIVVSVQASGDENDFKDFNPFEKKNSNTINPLITSNNKISLRQLRMKEVMNTLLQKVSLDEDEKTANEKILLFILNEHSELILEPLVDDNAVMDEDSIYDPGMTKDERFERYDTVMNQRIDKATNKSVRKILTLMKEFVSSYR